RLRVEPARIETRSIAGLPPAAFVEAQQRDATIRQLAYAEYDRMRAALTAWVAPAIVPRGALFGRADGPQNAAGGTGGGGGGVGGGGWGGGGGGGGGRRRRWRRSGIC